MFNSYFCVFVCLLKYKKVKMLYRLQLLSPAFQYYTHLLKNRLLINITLIHAVIGFVPISQDQIR